MNERTLFRFFRNSIDTENLPHLLINKQAYGERYGMSVRKLATITTPRGLIWFM